VSKNLLIVDDHEPTRGIIRSLLETRADLHICGEARNGLEAIEKARDLKPDLILLDLVMPKLNGAVAASILKKMLPKISIVLFTMYEGTANTLARAVEADLVLAKPDGIHALVDAVEKVLEPR